RALHAPFRRGTARAVGDELILRVLFDALNAQPSRFDCLTVPVLLRGAADTCRPEIRVADDAVGQGLFGDDVGDGETSTALQEACGLLKHAVLVGREVDHTVGNHAVESAGI